MKNLDQEHIHTITNALKEGEICLLPTDSGYEIVCDATNENAVIRAFSLIAEPKAYNYSIIVKHIDQIGRYTKEIPEIAEELLNVAISPLILVLPSACGLPQAVISNTGKAPFRVIAEGIISNILQKLQFPLLALPTSGDYSRITTSLDSVPNEIVSKIPISIATIQYDCKSPSIIELGLGGEVKIIKN